MPAANRCSSVFHLWDMWYWRSDAGVTRLTSCFVHIQWLRMRCMADSVARRPHTATSVSGLISPPSPIPVVLPVMLFPPPHPYQTLHYVLAISTQISPLSVSLQFPPGHVYLQPAWSLSDSPCVSLSGFPPCSLPGSFPLPPFSPPLWPRARLKLLVHLLSISLLCCCLSSSVAVCFWAERHYCVWHESADCCGLYGCRVSAFIRYNHDLKAKKKEEACIILHNHIMRKYIPIMSFFLCQRYWQFSCVPPSSCERSFRIRSSVIKCVYFNLILDPRLPLWCVPPLCRPYCLTHSGMQQHHAVRNTGSGGQWMAAGCTFTSHRQIPGYFTAAV